MNKTSIKILSFFLVLVSALTLNSCLPDEDKSPDSWLCMATVLRDGTKTRFLMDEGVVLEPVQSLSPDSFLIGKRYFLLLTFADTTNHAAKTYPVYVNQYQRATVRPIQVWAKDSADVWGNAPITSLYGWFSGHYFNAWFLSFYGTGSNNSFEFIRNLNKVSTKSTETEPEVYFSLRHNTESYSTNSTYNRTLSFDLSSLSAEFPNAHKILFNITCKDYSKGTQEFQITYYPSVVYLSPGEQAQALNQGWTIQPLKRVSH